MAIFWLILAGLMFILGIGFVAKGPIDVRGSFGETTTVPLRAIGFLTILAGLLTLFLNMFTVVEAKSVGVEHAFGKSRNTLSRGWNWVVPWSTIEVYDASLQPLKLSGGGGDNGDPIKVQMAGKTISAEVEVNMEWQLDENADITEIWKDYRTFDKITENVVRRRLSSALNTVFDKYDPLASLKGDGTTVSTATLETSVQTELQNILPAGIRINSLFIPKIVYPGNVQAQLDQYIAAVNDTKVAQQQKLTAIARREANEALVSGGATLTPGVLYQNCLDLVERLIKDGKALPPAFTCGAPPATVLPVK